MVVKIVTDSTSDISPEVAKELGITVAPVYVHFGEEVYRDGVDISNDEFYERLAASPVHPATSEPTPEDFVKVYKNCAKKADAILSIHVSARVSETYNSALQGKKLTKSKCQIEVLDSSVTSVGLALVVMAAARTANEGGSLLEVFEETRRAINQISVTGLVDTMKYLVLGKRLNKATSVVAGILDIKPLLTFRDGEIVRAGLAHTYRQGIDRLYQFAASTREIQDLAIAYSTDEDQARQLKARLEPLLHDSNVYLTPLGAGLGVHLGPGSLLVALRRR